MAASLPLDVIFDILLVWLPIKSLLRFQCVCKEWFNLIRNRKPSIGSIACLHNDTHIYLLGDDLESLGSRPATQLTHLPPINEYQASPIGSCNGLLCFYINNVPSDCFFLVCNPPTRTFKKLDAGEFFHRDTDLAYGFGYDGKNDDYKIVLVDWCGKDMFVYSLKLGSWRTLKSRSCSIDDFKGFLSSSSLFTNDRLHWIVTTKGCYYNIARFNLCSERWDEPLPLFDIDLTVFYRTPRFACLDGCLCLCFTTGYRASSSDTIIDIWMMMEYGVKESWTKLVSIAMNSSLTFSSCREDPITYSKSESKLLFLASYGSLFWYDMKHKTYTEVKPIITRSTEYEGDFFTSMPYFASRVSIPGTNEGD